MNLEKLHRRLQALAENPADLTELGRLARDLGHSLPTATLQELREFRAQAAGARDDLDDQAAFAKGLLVGLVEMITAYDAQIQAVGEREQLRRFVGQEVHFGVLRQLRDGPRLPGDLALAISTNPAQISRALRDLRALGLVDLMAPAALGDQRTKPHRLTPEGRALLQVLGNEPSGQGAFSEVSETVASPKEEPIEAVPRRGRVLGR